MMKKIDEKYKMLFITMFCYLFFYTGRHNFGWATKAMSEDLGISYSYIGWISFSMLIGYSIGQFINGNLADHFSPRLMVPIGAYLSIACNIGISFAYSAPVILVLWFFNGLFQSMAWAPGGKIITNWFESKEQNKAFGLYTMAAGLSSVVTFLISIVLTSFDMEWRMLFRVPVLFLLVSSTIFLIFIKPSPSESTSKKTDSPKRTFAELKSSYAEVLGNFTFVRLCISFGLESMARYGLIFWVPVHFLGKNWKEDPSFLWVTFLLLLGMAIGAVSFGQLAVSVFKNNFRSITFGMLVCSIISFSLYTFTSSNIIIIAFLLIACGFFVYGPQANFWALCPQILGKHKTGTAMGIMNMFGYLCAALIEPILGSVISFSKNTSILFIVIGGLCLAASINTWFLRDAKNVENY